MYQTFFMTKLFTLVFFCSLAAFASAQFDKNQKIIGGGIGLSTGQTTNPNAFYAKSKGVSLAVSPSFAKFTRPNQLCGIELSYRYVMSKYESGMNPYRENNHQISAGVFSQRFVSLPQNLFFTMMGSANVGYNFGTRIQSYTPINSKIEMKGYSVTAGLAPGLSYRLTPRWLLSASLNNFISAGFDHSESKDLLAVGGPRKSTSNVLNLSSSLSGLSLGDVSLGFRYLLKKK